MARSENLIVFPGAQKGRTCVRVFIGDECTDIYEHLDMIIFWASVSVV